MVVLTSPPPKPPRHDCRPPQDPEILRQAREGILTLRPDWLNKGEGVVDYPAEGDGSVWRCDECWELWISSNNRWIRYDNATRRQRFRCRRMDRKDPIFYRPRLNSAKQWKVLRHRDGTTSGQDSPYMRKWKERGMMKRAQSRKPPTGPSGQSKRSK
ncbi:hypothetical protein PBI_ASERPROCKY_46 [Gordonia phage ASerpRocky]|uniref:Uncharacterized protein n=1 Tax=Gordonia phage ASerpRocky TaxID=2599841 RepID=A0A5J6TCC7_9CAUD|nr:hypothetical protein PBI_ASERPROCKY_46 [Gordonia phage ASerpRocky]